MIFTYLLKTEKGDRYYIGISQNPKDRLIAHNAGKVTATKYKRPWTLVYQKGHLDYQEARKHEKWLKKKNREYKDKLAG